MFKLNIVPSAQLAVDPLNESQSLLQQINRMDVGYLAPTVSVIIPLYNNIAFIETAIRSVIDQQCNVELIIIDGGSTDGSWEVVQRYRDWIIYSISESDKGIYDAMNKGVAQAKGEWLYFLGADDAIQPNVLRQIIPYLTSDKVMVYGDICFNTGWQFVSRLNRRILFQNTIHHQGAFYHRSLFDAFRYDTSLKILSDYELNLKIYQHQLPTYKVPIVIACCREGGASSWIALSIAEANLVRAKYLRSSVLNTVLSAMLKLYYAQKRWRALLFKARKY